VGASFESRNLGEAEETWQDPISTMTTTNTYMLVYP
jgi:hypothetical protein